MSSFILKLVRPEEEIAETTLILMPIMSEYDSITALRHASSLNKVEVAPAI